ncbi:chemotaxis protein CheR [Geomonas limicola]|uniref:Chemotaxis protein CheR n=1 Tax=Geomonas limicola TaxID=2740186 RepID=A0A6V8N551_9BACT|nr:chemotaxis protein CheR [Geomonas limicola]GFO67510.1 chemotaxis protein CheR [Geomonas limicola]
MDLVFTPSLDCRETRRRLERLLVPGPLTDPALLRRVERLAERFASFAASYPLPLWAPGLQITEEMRSLSEALFPLGEVRPVTAALCRAGCRFPPLFEASYLYSSASWCDFLHRFQPGCTCADPSLLLSRLARDDQARLEFLFALFLPRHFGATFDRYPGQARFLTRWLRAQRTRLSGRIRALDSACGSGEGTYDLAHCIVEAGYPKALVHGSTLEHLELFAAAHAWFPHDAERGAAYRERIAPLVAPTSPVRFSFYREEVGSAGRERFDVVLCNGLLGGPLLHDAGGLAAAVAALAARLTPGGILLAADRFHAGWRLRVPPARLEDLLRDQGLKVREIEEGVAGEKPL